MKKQAGLLLIISLISHLALGQISGAVTDKATGKPVAYANIWVENENLGITSTEDGSFSFANSAVVGKVLVVSCLGYERGHFPITASPMKVQLIPAPVALQEVTVQKSKQPSRVVVDKLELSKSSHWYANGGTPWIVAEFFPYEGRFEATPFLEEIALLLWSRIQGAKFQIRLLEINEKGEPGRDLLPQPLIGLAPKGHMQKVAIDVSQYNLQIPKEGFFIAFEWFIIQENALESVYTPKGSKEKRKRVSYEPSILTRAVEEGRRNGWIYSQGAWNNAGFKSLNGSMYLNKSPLFQLTLSD